jgi:precorrin-8X/cobalt-precorrin-8 methylmutase
MKNGGRLNSSFFILNSEFPEGPTPNPQPLLARYGRPPAEIETVSLQRVDAALQAMGGWSDGERDVVRRVVYACGDPQLARLVRFHPDGVRTGVEALGSGAPILVDVHMVEVALDRELTSRLGCRVHRAIHHPSVAREARARGLSRAAVAIQRLAPRLPGSVAVIGTAPTALLALLDLVDDRRARPALIIGMPVGLVAAAEAKAELARRAVPFITIEGTRGGAALAAAATNALLRMAAQSSSPPKGGKREGEGGVH